MDPVTPHCKELASPGYFNFTLSILILIGILISYLPQHYRIISLRSSFGISPYFVLLGTTSGTSAFANILLLPQSAQDVACCREISGVACFAGMLGIFQVGVQWLCFAIILLLFIIYFPRATSPTSPTTPIAINTTTTTSSPSLAPRSAPTDEEASPTSYRTALAVTALCILHALTIVLISVAFAVRNPQTSLESWAIFLGIMAAILASIQYLPQIYTTYRLRCVGSLSIPMMCIQTPGSLVWAASLAARLGKPGWSAWGVYVVTACLQGTLLAMGIYFEYISPRKKEVHHYDDRIQATTAGGARHSESRLQQLGDGDLAGHDPSRQPPPAAPPTEETPLLHS